MMDLSSPKHERCLEQFSALTVPLQDEHLPGMTLNGGCSFADCRHSQDRSTRKNASLCCASLILTRFHCASLRKKGTMHLLCDFRHLSAPSTVRCDSVEQKK